MPSSQDQSPTNKITGHVLVVDDEPLTVEAVCSLLRLDGLEATGVYSGPEAIDFLKSSLQPNVKDVDLVLLDWFMPGMSGALGLSMDQRALSFLSFAGHPADRLQHRQMPRSSASTVAPTTLSPSRTIPANYSPGYGRCCVPTASSKRFRNTAANWPPSIKLPPP